jgi:hypothetical protein
MLGVRALARLRYLRLQCRVAQSRSSHPARAPTARRAPFQTTVAFPATAHLKRRLRPVRCGNTTST